MLPKPVAYLTSDEFDNTLPDGKSYLYVLAGNGLFKFCESPFLTALIPLAACRIAGLPKLRARVEPRHKIPGTVLGELLRDARKHHREVMYHLHWDNDTNKVVVAKPRQRGATASVDYRITVDRSVEDYPILCDVHSHPGGTHFSGTDNQDESEFRFYAVIGCLRSTPEIRQIRLRLGMYDDHYPVSATTLFTDTGPFVDAIGRRMRDAYEEVRTCKR